MSNDSVSIFVNDGCMFSIKPLGARAVYIPNMELQKDDTFLHTVERLVMYRPEDTKNKIDSLIEASIRYATERSTNKDEER